MAQVVVTFPSIWEFMDEPDGPAAEAKAEIYDSEDNFYERFLSTVRSKRKNKNAINHCMYCAKHFHKKGNIPLSLDWLVAAAGFGDSPDEVLDPILEFFEEIANRSITSWSDLLQKPPMDIGPRLLALTLLRILSLAKWECKADQQGRLTDFCIEHLKNEAGHLRVKKDQANYEKIQGFKTLEEKLEENLSPIFEASRSPDLSSINIRNHEIQQKLNHKLVKGVLSAGCPHGFLKSRISHLMKLINELVEVTESRFVETAESALREVDLAIEEIKSSYSYYSLKYILPLLKNIKTAIDNCFDASDAIKPANLELILFPRRYPLHAVGKKTIIRFKLINSGPGPASDVALEILFAENVEPLETSISFADLEAGVYDVPIEIKLGDIQDPANGMDFEAKVTWTDFSGEQRTFFAERHIEAQSASVNWNNLLDNEPYSILPIEPDSNRPFVGRKTDVQKLVRSVASQAMGSAYIHGQKRVGKTSLAHSLTETAKLKRPNNFYSVYLEGGDYVEATPEGTIGRMGRMIAKRIRKSATRFASLPMPEFSDSLSPLNEFVEDLLDAHPEARLLIVLDEFDELPIELYKRGSIGDAFFLSLRTLSGKSRVGVVLVGGEKIAPIMSAQGDQLNRFSPMSVDYFRRDEHWEDFVDLVRKPVKDSIAYSDAAIETIFLWSQGNPYFSNLICTEIINNCYARKDAFVTEFEVLEAAEKACQLAGVNSFQHFWEDGVLESGNRVEEISILRRRILLAFAAVVRSGRQATFEGLFAQPVLSCESEDVVRAELKRFQERGILIDSNGRLSCRIYFFEQFLREKSAELISTDFTDQDERIKIEKEENELYVKPREVVDLVDSWGVYCGRKISTDDVRSWLGQFESNKDQRLMFKLLESTKFYGEQLVAEKFGSVVTHLKKWTIERRKLGQRTRKDILVTYLGGPGKSGAQFARKFCEVSNIVKVNVCSFPNLPKRFANQNDTQAIVILEDYIGSGQSAITAFEKMDQEIGNQLREAKCQLFFFAICANESSRILVEQKVASLQLPIEIVVGDTLTTADKAFDTNNDIFESNSDRLHAERLAKEIGIKLERKWPLGYEDGQSLVVFYSNCPNNSLPILHKGDANWRPLFKRH